ncbi:MAG TPA: sodium:proton exchanger [Actinomycetota bacterium]|nr:sodium:proton exchanger [Actinomycetota bacterium]
MTTQLDDLRDVHPGRQGLGIGIALGVTVPALLLRFLHPDLPHAAEAVLFGVAIVGAAFLLSWAAEVAQLDISAGLAIAVLAFIAVLPEYAVDMVFAWKGGNAVEAYGASCHPPGASGEDACSLALANMTGANRLLIGIGWSLVVFIAYWRSKNRPGGRIADVRLERSHSVEVSFLAIATLYSLTLPLKHTITLVDAVILVGIFTAYTWRISRAPAEEPHLVGPARLIGTFSTHRRRLTVVLMFVFAAAVILACAEQFAESLVETGREFGISEFLLVQWLAPLASEAPELLVAGLYAWRLNTNAGLGTLVSSKVNQWTLLVGTLPIVFALASGGLSGLPIDPHQREELFLTAAQSFFAIAVLVTLSISVREALLLFGLFWAQFVIGAIVPESAAGAERVAVGATYLVLGVIIFARERRRIVPLLRDGLRTPYAALNAPDGAEAVGE